jgi:hypothetical protein
MFQTTNQLLNLIGSLLLHISEKPPVPPVRLFQVVSGKLWKQMVLDLKPATYDPG